MTDLDKLKEAFEKWAQKEDVMRIEHEEKPYGWTEIRTPKFAKDAGEILFPFVAHVLNDPNQSIKHLGLINTLKFKLGMKLMAHEMVGVELESKGPVK